MFIFVCLSDYSFVCEQHILKVMDCFQQNIWEWGEGLYKEQMISCWKTSIEHRPKPTSKGIITHLIILEGIQ